MFFKKKTTASSSSSSGGAAANGDNSNKAVGNLAPSSKEVREMVNTRLIARMNVILEQCGLSFTHPSTQIYSKPQRVHAIAPSDLGFIASNAHLLVTRKDVICDFEALSTVLWGMMTEVESVVDKLVDLRQAKHKPAIIQRSANATKTSDTIVQSKEQQQQMSTTNQVQQVRATEGNINTTNNNNNNSQQSQSTEKFYTTLESVLVQILRVLLIVRALESVDALDEVRNKLHPLQSNVELLIRITYQLIKLFHSVASTILGKDYYNTESSVISSNIKVKTSPSSLSTTYSPTAHMRLRLLELSITSLLQCTALLTSRPTLDVSATLHLLSSQEVWEMTGCGFASLNGYCNAVEVCIKTLYTHRAEYDNVNEIVAELIWTRLAKRPAFNVQLFQLLCFRSSEWNSMNSSNNSKVTLHKDILIFGLLLHTRRVQRAIEELVDFNAHISSSSSPSSSSVLLSAEHNLLSLWSPYLQAASLHYFTSRETQKACLTYLRTLENSPQPELLSYSQLLLLAAIEGMPLVDFTNDEALHKRAKKTMLVCAEDVPLLDVKMLRLLMACCYTVHYTFNTHKANEEAAEEAEASSEYEGNGNNVFKSFHSTLSVPSVLVIYDAMAHYLFQMDKLKCFRRITKNVSYSNSKLFIDDSTLRGFLASGQLRVNSLMRLLLVNAIRNSNKKDESYSLNVMQSSNSTTHTNEPESLEPQENNITNKEATEVVTEAVNKKSEEVIQLIPSQGNACVQLLVRVTDVLRILFDANNAAEEERVKQINTSNSINNNKAERNHSASRSSTGNMKNDKEMQLVAATQRKDERATTLRTITRMMATSHFMLFHSNEFIKRVNRSSALECMVRIFALRTYYSASPQTPLQEQVLDKVFNRLMREQLTLMMLQMNPFEINHIVTNTLSSMCNASVAHFHSLLELRMMEAYLRALSTSSAAFVMEDATLLNHYMNIFLYCVTVQSALSTLNDTSSKNRLAYAQSQHVNLFNDLVMAAHDFLVATFWARKPLSILFVPTYVSVFVPSPNKPAKYGLPSLPVIKHFASRVRAACEGMEMCAPFSEEQWSKLSECNITELKDNSSNSNNVNGMNDKQLLATSTLSNNTSNTHESQKNNNINKNVVSNFDNNNNIAANLTEAQREAILEITPSNATMLVVAALFDKLCDLWSKQTIQHSKNGGNTIVDSVLINEFTAYFSALVNLLQCKDNAVLQRVCASVEAIEVEHLRGSGNAQLQFLKYIESTVDNIRGTTKKSIAEWLLKVSAKVTQENRATSKL